MKRKITFVVLLAVLAAATGVTFSYFSERDLEGAALMNMCACGYCRVHMSDGIIKLAEPNHDRRTGDIVGRYDPAGTNVTVFSGTNEFTVATTRDHLGLRYVGPLEFRQYHVLTHKWKAYIHAGWTRITR